MSIQKLWYIKLGGEIQGPFPAKIIVQRILLNRVTIHDLVSLDKLAWLPIHEFEELLPQASPQDENATSEVGQEALKWREERIKASHRWMDERTGERRDEAMPSAHMAQDTLRAGSDRRKASEDGHAYYLRSHFLKHMPVFSARHRYVGAIIFLALTGTVIMLGMQVPVNPVKVDIGAVSLDCSKSAEPEINWRACDKQGVWLQDVRLSGANLIGTRFNSAVLKNADLSYANLTGADFSYANLIHAKLIGANLQQANLTYAELQDADLRQADLRGATLDNVALTGAKLDNAVWLDGSMCAPASIGQCNNK